MKTFSLYTGIFTHYKDTTKESLARHIFNSNPSVTLLRTIDRGQIIDVRKESSK